MPESCRAVLLKATPAPPPPSGPWLGSGPSGPGDGGKGLQPKGHSGAGWLGPREWGEGGFCSCEQRLEHRPVWEALRQAVNSGRDPSWVGGTGGGSWEPEPALATRTGAEMPGLPWQTMRQGPYGSGTWAPGVDTLCQARGPPGGRVPGKAWRTRRDRRTAALLQQAVLCPLEGSRGWWQQRLSQNLAADSSGGVGSTQAIKAR